MWNYPYIKPNFGNFWNFGNPRFSTVKNVEILKDCNRKCWISEFATEAIFEISEIQDFNRKKNEILKYARRSKNSKNWKFRPRPSDTTIRATRLFPFKWYTRWLHGSYGRWRIAGHSRGLQIRRVLQRLCGRVPCGLRQRTSKLFKSQLFGVSRKMEYYFKFNLLF